MADVEYHHDYEAFGAEVLRAPWMEADMVDRAVHAQSVAEFLASGHIRTGRYAASFVIESGRDGGDKHDRAYARLANTDPHAADIEFGHTVRGRDTVTKTGKRRAARRSAGATHVEGQYILTRSMDGFA